jgi:RNA polymerase sigma-70 factor (ECF subfamily)
VTLTALIPACPPATTALAVAREGAGGDAGAMGMRFRDERGPERRAERRLVREAQGGSSEAIEQLFRRHWPGAYRAAYMVIRDRAAAEDVTQEAFIAAIRALDRFDRSRPFAPWLQRIAINKAIDHARARSSRREVGTATEPESPPPREGEGDPREDDLQRALAALSPEQRAIVAMRFVLDLTPGEIARRLELPRGTVNSRLRRALDRLAGEIGGGR